MRTRTPRRSTVQIFKMPANQASAGNSNCTVSIIKNANTMRLLHISAPPLEKYTVRSLFVGGLAPFGIIRKISKSQLRSVSALRAKTVRKPHGLETTRARYSFLNFGSVPSCALFGLVLVFWHRFDGSWCYCGLLGFQSLYRSFESNQIQQSSKHCFALIIRLCDVRSSLTLINPS